MVNEITVNQILGEKVICECLYPEIVIDEWRSRHSMILTKEEIPTITFCPIFRCKTCGLKPDWNRINPLALSPEILQILLDLAR